MFLHIHFCPGSGFVSNFYHTNPDPRIRIRITDQSTTSNVAYPVESASFATEAYLRDCVISKTQICIINIDSSFTESYRQRPTCTKLQIMLMFCIFTDEETGKIELPVYLNSTREDLLFTVDLPVQPVSLAQSENTHQSCDLVWRCGGLFVELWCSSSGGVVV